MPEIRTDVSTELVVFVAERLGVESPTITDLRVGLDDRVPVFAAYDADGLIGFIDVTGIKTVSARP